MDHLKKKPIQYGILILEVVVLTIILWTLTGGTGVAFDEAFTWKLVTDNDFAGIAKATAADVHPPLYYFIAKLTLGIFGKKLRVLSMTSVAPSVILMILAATIIYRRWGFWVSFIFNLGVALSPTMSYYNVESRMYSWVTLFVVGELIFGRECLERKLGKESLVYWIFFYLLGMGAVYTQYFGAIPVIVCYFWMGFSFIRRKEGKKVISLFVCAGLSVVGYLPWLQTLLDTYGSGGASEEYEMSLTPYDFFDSLFGSNLKASPLMAMILFFMAAFLLILLRNRYDLEERWFLWMLVINAVICFVSGQLIGKGNGHFFAFRYIIFVIPMLWWFMGAVHTKLHWCITLSFVLWTMILCEASYADTYNYRYNMTPLMEKTVEFTDANIADDAILVYDFPTFDTIYSYYLPGHEFIYITDLDLEQMRGKTFWIIRMGEDPFSDEVKEAYHMSTEEYGRFGYMGMERFDLEKVMVAP